MEMWQDLAADDIDFDMELTSLAQVNAQAEQALQAAEQVNSGEVTAAGILDDILAQGASGESAAVDTSDDYVDWTQGDEFATQETVTSEPTDMTIPEAYVPQDIVATNQFSSANLQGLVFAGAAVIAAGAAVLARAKQKKETVESSKATKLYYSVNGQTYGPLAEEEIKRQVSSGKLPNDALLWLESKQQWQPYNKVYGAVSAAPRQQPQLQAQPQETANWHVAINNKTAGPFTASAVSNMLTSGQINNNTLVWQAGMANWAKLSEVVLR